MLEIALTNPEIREYFEDTTRNIVVQEYYEIKTENNISINCFDKPVELKSKEEEFVKPNWLGKEVTGDKHAEWIATDLKAWVDSTYRTKPEPEYTTIGGASLGGLMAYYMIMTFPETFQNAIVFSPSLWVNEKVFSLHEQVNDFNNLKIYLNIGDQEGGYMVPNAKQLNSILQNQGMGASQLQFDIEKNAGHEQLTWRKGFKKAYPWIVQR